MVSAIWFHHFYILNLIKYLTCLYAKSIKKVWKNRNNIDLLCEKYYIFI